MEKVMVFMMVFAATFGIWAKNTEIAIMDRAYRTVQYSLDHAVHDAALQVNNAELAKGTILFDEVLAEQALIETLRLNLSLDENLHPLEHSLIDGPVVIQDIQFLDDDYIEPLSNLTLSFPLNHPFNLPNGEVFTRALFGPSVALIANVKVKGSDTYESMLVIQEYKVKN